MRDAAIAVREAALELLGKYAVAAPGLGQRYYPAIADRALVRGTVQRPARRRGRLGRLADVRSRPARRRGGPWRDGDRAHQDKGVSVRKRVVKILRDLVVQRPGEVDAVDVCARLLRLCEDEEASVQVEAANDLKDILLADLPGLAERATSGTTAAAATTTASSDLPAATRAALAIRADMLAGLAAQPDAAERFRLWASAVGCLADPREGRGPPRPDRAACGPR